ncbi:MAG: methyltransferase domain-containing protein [Syntrophobacterales bacterium]|nr:methyltransferase domain-containing protein [Syntrophobacterales bacterium]
MRSIKEPSSRASDLCLISEFYSDLYAGRIGPSVDIGRGFRYLVELGYDEEVLTSFWNFPWEFVYPCGCPTKYFRWRPNLRILNIGGGVGLDGFYAAMLFPIQEGLIVNLDIAFPGLLRSKVWAEEFFPKDRFTIFTWVCANGYELPFGERTFDVVILNGVFNIFKEKKRLLTETARTLTACGIVLIADLFVRDKLPQEISSNFNALAWSMAGAITSDELKRLAQGTGFSTPLFHEKKPIDDLFYRAVCSISLLRT